MVNTEFRIVVVIFKNEATGKRIRKGYTEVLVCIYKAQFLLEESEANMAQCLDWIKLDVSR